MRFSKLECEKFVFRRGTASPFMNLLVTPGGTSGTSAVRPFVDHKYMFFTVKNSRVQSISQGLHFSMSYNVFGSGMKTLSPDSCNSLRDFGNLWSFIWIL